MRLNRSLPAAALVFGLVAGLGWCALPCCGSTGSAASPLSIGTVSCCASDTPSTCQATIHRADDVVAPPGAPSLPPIALGHGTPTPTLRILQASVAIARPTLSRADLARLDVPLLI
jgi:hypothetical protein